MTLIEVGCWPMFMFMLWDKSNDTCVGYITAKIIIGYSTLVTLWDGYSIQIYLEAVN